MTERKEIVCFGEVLWDIYPDMKRLGGAPFNVAAHLKLLGTDSAIITRIGRDDLGKEIHDRVIEFQLPTVTVQHDDTLPTGTVQVELDSKGIPSYIIKQPVAWDAIKITSEALSAVKASKALIFGSLACRSDSNLVTLKELASHSSLKVCDLNIRQSFYSEELINSLLDITDILKINHEEAELLIKSLKVSKNELYQHLAEHFDIDIIIQTKGKDGAEAYSGGTIHHSQGPEVDAIDTVGAGDAFLAAFVHNYISGNTIEECLYQGCLRGGLVATKRGAIPDLEL